MCYVAVELDPSDATALSKRSFSLVCLGDGEEAWSDAKACIKLRPDWPEAYYRAGRALSALEKFDAAAKM
ncbi:hypothetical protein IFM89_024771 [Coptis chinensis]|uniref:Uncharacterized protein n=1 Tax=Coptis chinensis TaxID=261450 RepID=A0A835HP77_9MAGN|nr:hypothetical protein IFM89_024771 [Coptis chinensis]